MFAGNKEETLMKTFLYFLKYFCVLDFRATVISASCYKGRYSAKAFTIFQNGDDVLMLKYYTQHLKISRRTPTFTHSLFLTLYTDFHFTHSKNICIFFL